MVKVSTTAVGRTTSSVPETLQRGPLPSLLLLVYVPVSLPLPLSFSEGKSCSVFPSPLPRRVFHPQPLVVTKVARTLRPSRP